MCLIETSCTILPLCPRSQGAKVTTRHRDLLVYCCPSGQGAKATNHRDILAQCCHSAQRAKASVSHRDFLHIIATLPKEPRRQHVIEIYLYTVVPLPKEPRQLNIEIYLHNVVTLPKKPRPVCLIETSCTLLPLCPRSQGNNMS